MLLQTFGEWVKLVITCKSDCVNRLLFYVYIFKRKESTFCSKRVISILTSSISPNRSRYCSVPRKGAEMSEKRPYSKLRIMTYTVISALLVGYFIVLITAGKSVIANFNSTQTAQLQQAGFTQVDIQPGSTESDTPYAQVDAAPNCRITLNWVNGAEAAADRWEYNGLAKKGFVYVVTYDYKIMTTAKTLIQAGACDH